jgi:flagellar basal-body rod modification protein FlgD
VINATDVTKSLNNLGVDYAGNTENVLGKEEFLKLLITQLRHQDPLEPMKNEEYVAQLAQFSSLEQMQNINEKLEASLQSDLLMAQSISNSMVTALIGKEAKIQTDQIMLPESGETSFGFRSDQTYSSAQVSVYDENGSIVFYKELKNIAPGDTTMDWDGRSAVGTKVDPGKYRLEVKLVNGDEEGTVVPTFISGEVSAVKYDQGVSSLVINGQLFNIANVLEVGN